ncbi:hypothetical protein [Tahibacter amnicola]|uniref:DUF732 domain-containing protein n=1 Tax=Tahibacter amnicola TaxID=2976241 RepID=A0ABY6BKV5_9GAMM|nr:hypothetical protein [Tahibacter amnicola]UXI70246.1 hypothetical protein N4264_11605 [Tahibacter amnicola]
MRRLFVLCAAVAALSGATSASAHETVPKDWCTQPAASPLVVDEFQFDGAGLRHLIDKCGIVDLAKPPDAWTQVSLAIDDYCSKLDVPGLADTPVPIIAAPKSYRTSGHHLGYSIDQGLAGVCAVCVTP